MGHVAGRGCFVVVRGCLLRTVEGCCEWHASGTVGDGDLGRGWRYWAGHDRGSPPFVSEPLPAVWPQFIRAHYERGCAGAKIMRSCARVGILCSRLLWRGPCSPPAACRSCGTRPGLRRRLRRTLIRMRSQVQVLAAPPAIPAAHGHPGRSSALALAAVLPGSCHRTPSERPDHMELGDR